MDSKLYLACKWGQLNLVKSFLENGSNKDNAVTYAARYDKLDIVKYLVFCGANVNTTRALSGAVLYGHFSVVKFLGDNGADLTSNGMYEAFLCACQQGYLQIVQYFVENGCPVTIQNDQGVLDAALFGHFDVAKYLVGNGANVCAKDDQALRSASDFGHFDSVKFLVSKGANVFAKQDESLRFAAANGHWEIVKFLVEHGANVASKNYEAVQWAFDHNHVSCAIYLAQFHNVKDFNHDNFVCFYILLTSFFNKEKWEKNQEIKQDYLFDSNLALIVASFTF